ncbi:6-bladed beta-propeller [Spirosoma sp. HMF4905]|uniref:6-bladed beta-propeller n=1 Tax=Spirosoma arboris TaxID=2682092 RepID=A0A7K1SI24_9BACT|nr:6-bladed beta-propeller [Spirosoma arboris]MVM33413.1 6-bladed beta-propeller [Spirosoma arboris]
MQKNSIKYFKSSLKKKHRLFGNTSLHKSHKINNLMFIVENYLFNMQRLLDYINKSIPSITFGLILIFNINCSRSNESAKLSETSIKATTIDVFSDMDSEIIIDSLIKEIDVVHLETNKKCLIGKINDIKIADNKIYILDKSINKAVYIFDRKGKFIKKIFATGAGPLEFLKPFSMDVDEDSKGLYIYDNSLKKIVKYDLNGKFLKNIKTPTYFNDFVFSNGNFIIERGLFANQLRELSPEFDKHNLIVMDSTFSKIIAGYLEPIGKDNKNNFRPISKSFSKSSDLKFFPRFSDELFIINKSNRLNSLFKFDLGDLKIESHILNGPFEDMIKYMKNNSNKHIYASDFCGTDKAIYLRTFALKESSHGDIYTFYLKNKKKAISGNKIKIESYNKIPFFIHPAYASKSEFISVLNYEIFEPFLRKLDSKADQDQILSLDKFKLTTKFINEQSNPTLLLYTIE